MLWFLKINVETMLIEFFYKGVEVKYQELFPCLRLTYPRFDELKVEIVVAVPPGRSTVVHEEVRQAFVQGFITSNDVSLTSEPASMFCSWVHDHESSQDWKVCDNPVLVWR